MADRTRVGVKIMPREVILDTQGRAVEQTLKLNGMPAAEVRVGRFVELEINAPKEQAKAQAEEIAKKLLYNPLIETFEIKEM